MRATAAALAALLLAAGGSGLARAQEPEEPGVFPDGPGRDEVFGLCTACHGSRLVRNQAMTRERWDETLAWMSERHGMPELEGDERALVLDYLAASFGPRADAAGRTPFLKGPARVNPFAPP